MPGEPEREELLRLLGEEIASVKEEFAYAEKANAERADLERDACLAPEGETWVMLLRQEASLDRSIDRKVRILIRLRKDSADLPIGPAGQEGGGKMDKIEEMPEGDIMSTPPTEVVEAMEGLKMKEQCGNVDENKASLWKSTPLGGAVHESRAVLAHFEVAEGEQAEKIARDAQPLETSV